MSVDPHRVKEAIVNAVNWTLLVVVAAVILCILALLEES